MMRSTSTSGLTRAGSPLARAIAERIAARSTTAGTPVKSCIKTRDGMNATDASGAGAGHPARAETSWSRTSRVPALRRRFSRRIRTVWGSRSTSPTPRSASHASRYSSTAPRSVVISSFRVGRTPWSQTVVLRLRRRNGALDARGSVPLGRPPVALDGLAVRQAHLAPNLRLSLPAAFGRGLRHETGNGSRLSCIVERDEHEVRARGVMAFTADDVLDINADADLERGRSDVVHGRGHRH